MVSLPADARKRLASPLRAHTFSGTGLRTFHTLPVLAPAWAAHTAALSAAVTALATSVPSTDVGFDQCRRSVEDTISHAGHVLSHLLAIQPFAPFDHEAGERLLGLVIRRLAVVADHLDGDSSIDVDSGLLGEGEGWRASTGVVDVRAALRAAFAMEDAPVDETGQFRAEWVLAHYAYRAHDLLPHLLPNLASLGLPGLTDILAAVTVVGEVLSCNDPVSAYVAMDGMVSDALTAEGTTSAAVRDHLAKMEPALRRARNAAARSSQTIRDEAAETEARANALADAYKRLLEGPFRQFAWARYCLSEGLWQDPPTLGVLRDRLVAAGGGLGAVTADVVIPEFRNAEAHETLVWDGFVEQFSTEGVEIAPAQVVASAQLAQCFVAGSEAGLTALRFLDLPGDAPRLPDHNEPGRMPVWRRVQAFFGTNRLRLLDASLNTKHASLRVERLGLTDVNPCLQALVLSRRLMPNVETFSVADSGGDAVVTVAAEALSATMAAWELAVSNLDQIPLSTFLPANLDARLRHEDANVAVRSVAWIAVDDAVGVVDGSPETWEDEDRSLIDMRLKIVELAVRSTGERIVSPEPRLRSVAKSVAALREWVVRESPTGPHLVDRRPEMARLRLQWERWGPVPRHPLVPERDTRDPDERQPALRAVRTSTAFQHL